MSKKVGLIVKKTESKGKDSAVSKPKAGLSPSGLFYPWRATFYAQFATQRLFNAMQMSFYALQRSYSTLQRLYSTLQRSYSTLQRSYSTLQRSYSALQRSYSALQRSYSAMQRSYSTLQRSYSAMQRLYSTLQRSYSALQTACSAMQRSCRAIYLPLIQNAAKLRLYSELEVKINPKHEARNPKQIQNSKAQNSKQKQVHSGALVFVFCFGHLFFGHWDLFRISNFEFRISYLSDIYP